MNQQVNTADVDLPKKEGTVIAAFKLLFQSKHVCRYSTFQRNVVIQSSSVSESGQ